MLTCCQLGLNSERNPVIKMQNAFSYTKRLSTKHWPFYACLTVLNKTSFINTRNAGAIFVILDSGNGYCPFSSKPLSEQITSNHQLHIKVLIWDFFFQNMNIQFDEIALYIIACKEFGCLLRPQMQFSCNHRSCASIIIRYSLYNNNHFEGECLYLALKPTIPGKLDQ